MTETAEPTDPKQYQTLFKQSLRELIATIPAAQDGTVKNPMTFIRTTLPQLIARLSNLSSRIATVKDDRAYDYYCQAWQAVLILQRSTEQLGAAEAIIEQLERNVSRTAALRGIMLGLGYYLGVTVLLFALLAAFGTVSGVDLAAGTMQYALLGISIAMPVDYLLACAFGILGSVVSIFFRLSEFESLIGKAKPFLIWTGVLLPIVGSIFAIVIYAMLQLGIVDISLGAAKVANSNDLRIAIVVGFLCGFSERFARGMLEKIAGSTDAKPTGAKAA